MLPRVLLVGGAPMVGKSTVARLLARRHDRDVISTDDVGVAVSAALGEPAMTEDHREYYVRRTVDELWQEQRAKFHALEAPIRALARLHANAWSTATIIEGWAILPTLLPEPVVREGAVWLVGTRALLEARIMADEAFWRGAIDESQMRSKFVERSLRLYDVIRDAAKTRALRTVSVNADDTPDTLANRIEALFG